VACYTYSPGYVDAVAVQERNLNADGDFGDDDEVVYYHTNTLFSVYALTDGDENVVERYRYDAYGAVTVLDDDWSADADGASDVDNPYTFTGRRIDTESGLMQYRHRCYSPALGRFTNRDPAGYAEGPSLYGAFFAPCNVDPAGTTTAKRITQAAWVYWNNVISRLARKLGYEMSAAQHYLEVWGDTTDDCTFYSYGYDNAEGRYTFTHPLLGMKVIAAGPVIGWKHTDNCDRPDSRAECVTYTSYYSTWLGIHTEWANASIPMASSTITITVCAEGHTQHKESAAP